MLMPKVVPVALRGPVAELLRITLKVIVPEVVLVPGTVATLEPVLYWMSSGAAVLGLFVFFLMRR